MRSGPLSSQARIVLWLRLGIRFFLAGVVIWLLARFARPLLSLFVPFLAALAAAALLNPLVHWLQRRTGWSRQFLTFLLLLTLFTLVGGSLVFLIYAAGQELMELLQNWDSLLGGLQAVMDQFERHFSQFLSLVPPRITHSLQTAADELLAWLGRAVPEVLTAFASRAGRKALGLPSFLIAVLMFLTATFLLTADYPYLRGQVAARMEEPLLRLCKQLRITALGAFGGYLKAQLLLSTGVFLILLVGFWITRQPYGLLLALGLAVLDFIPLLGAGTVMVPWAITTLFTRSYPTAIRIMVIWCIIALFRRVMEPKFVGDQTGLPPLLSLISIYVGMKLAGIWGMILAPILLLVVLNLSGMGMFRGLYRDVTAALHDLTILLSQPTDWI